MLKRHNDEAGRRPAAPKSRAFTVATLTRLAIASALAPVLLLMAAGLYRLVHEVRQAEVNRLSQQAETLMAAVDRELAGYAKIAESVARSRALQAGDASAAGLPEYASGVFGGRIAVLDRLGRPLATPPGGPSGDSSAVGIVPSATLATVFDKGETVVFSTSGTAAVGTRSPSFGAAAPARVDGEVRFAVAYTAPPDAMQMVLKSAPIADGRVASILDRSGVIVARSRSHERLSGQSASRQLLERMTEPNGLLQTVDLEGMPSTTAYRTSPATGWRVVLWVSDEQVAAPGRQALFLIATAMAGATLLSLLVGNALSGAIRRPIEDLVAETHRLGSATLIEPRPSRMEEANVISRMLAEASERIERHTRDLADSTIAAKTSEERYRRLVEGLSDVVVWEGDPKTGAFTFVSPAAEALLGYPEQEWLREPAFWLDHVHPEDRAHAATRSQARDDGVAIEYRMIASDGRTVWVRESVFLDEQDIDTSVIRGLMVDITKWKETELALEANEERLRVATDAAGLGVVEWHIGEDTAIFENRRCNEIFGHDPDDRTLTRANFLSSYVHPDDEAEFAAALQRGVAAGTSFSAVCRIRRKNDGETRWIECAGNFKRDDAGVPKQLVGVVADITDRKRAEAELIRSTSLLQAVSDGATDCIYVKDLESRIIFANPATVRVFGVPHEQLIGTTGYHSANSARDVDEFLTNDRRVMQSGVAETLEETFTGADGKRVYMSMKAPLRDGQGKLVGLIGVSRDITERKRSEEHTRLLLQEVSHRAKNMLAVTQAIVRQTSREVDPLSFAERVTARLAGLAASHDLLVDSDWRSVGLLDLVVAQLAKSGEAIGRGITAEGPPLALKPAAAQAIGMALHELVTNAARFGALSGQRGRVDIVWAHSGSGDDGVFEMIWEESGGPAVSPPDKKGFGYAVLVRMVEHALDGKVTLDYADRGIRWHVAARTSNVLG